ncbi:MAG: DUF5916 domain-containing protein [Gemmatimonadota bacterium]
MALGSRVSRARLLVVLALPGVLSAQGGPLTSPAHATVPRIQATPLEGEVHLDGRLDEATWAAAIPIELGSQRDPDEGRQPTERTEVRILVGPNALYIGARMFDREPTRISRRLGRRDDSAGGDRFSIFLDSRHDHLTAFQFDVFPAGNKGDAAIGADGRSDDSWDPVWEVATSVDQQGWTAELRIPLSQLRFSRGADEWGIQFTRLIQRKQEEDVFSFVPRSENDGVNRYGHLSGMRDLGTPRRLEVTPYASASARYDQTAPGNPFRDGSDFNRNAGADLRMGLTSDLTLDATINPDFGQVEVDPAVVNLSAFETTFPEKRPFFVEGADLFAFGQLHTYNNFNSPITFFSRRIGRSPQGFVADPDATVTDVPTQTTIAAAVKLTGKLRGGWSVAMLNAVTPEEQGRYVTTAGGPVRRAAVEPLTNYFAARVRREFHQGNTAVGALLTAVDRSLNDEVLSGALRSSAYLGGLDFTHFWGNRNWALDASIASSLVRGTPDAIARTQRASARYLQRPDAPELGYDPLRTSLSGHATQLAVTKVAGGHWGGNIALQEKSPGLETNDIGLTSTTGRRGIATDLHYYESRPGPVFRQWTLGVLSGNDWNYAGDHTTNYLGSIQNFTFRNFWRLNTSVFHNLPSYDDQLTRGGPLAKLPSRTNVSLFLASSNRHALSLGVEGALNWNAAGGYFRSVGLNATMQSAPNVRVSFQPTFSRSRNISQYVQRVDDDAGLTRYGRRDVFATLDQHELALDTRLNWTLSPKFSVQLFVQPLISTGAFTGYKEFRTRGAFDFDVYGKDVGTITRDAANSQLTIDPDGNAGTAAPFTVASPDFNFRSLRGNAVIRWEYRPGSTLFLVWQQSREGSERYGDFSLGRDFNAIFHPPATNVFAIKATYWMGL